MSDFHRLLISAHEKMRKTREESYNVNLASFVLSKGLSLLMGIPLAKVYKDIKRILNRGSSR